MRVLIVEDEADLAAALKRLLEEAGFSADIADDGEAGLTLALDEAYDLVVYSGTPIVVDGRAFSPATTFSDEGDETALVELTSSGIQERLRVRGELRKVFRLR